MSYQPQASDTHPEIDRFLMQAFRQMPTCKKAHLINEATKGIPQWAVAGIRHQHPNATIDLVFKRLKLLVLTLFRKIIIQVVKNILYGFHIILC